MKHTIKITQEFDLSEMPFDDALKLAFDKSNEREIAERGRKLTYEILAARCGMKTSTVHRYFTDPQYDCPLRKISRLNQGLGNRILTEWLCAQEGGIFARVDATSVEDMNIVSQVNKMNESSAAVISAVLTAVEDGTISSDELKPIIRKLREHARNVEQASICAEGRCTTGTA